MFLKGIQLLRAVVVKEVKGRSRKTVHLVALRIGNGDVGQDNTGACVQGISGFRRRREIGCGLSPSRSQDDTEQKRGLDNSTHESQAYAAAMFRGRPSPSCLEPNIFREPEGSHGSSILHDGRHSAPAALPRFSIECSVPGLWPGR